MAVEELSNLYFQYTLVHHYCAPCERPKKSKNVVRPASKMVVYLYRDKNISVCETVIERNGWDDEGAAHYLAHHYLHGDKYAGCVVVLLVEKMFAELSDLAFAATNNNLYHSLQ